MTVPRQRSAAKNQPEMFEGLNWDGSMLRSEIPIDNAPTRLVRSLIARVRDDCLSPRQIVDLIALEAPKLRLVFSPACMDQWQMLDHFWHWPAAQTSRASETAVKHGGRRNPAWLSDPYAWNQAVKRACDIHGDTLPEPPRDGVAVIGLALEP